MPFSPIALKVYEECARFHINADHELCEGRHEGAFFVLFSTKAMRLTCFGVFPALFFYPTGFVEFNNRKELNDTLKVIHATLENRILLPAN